MEPKQDDRKRTAEAHETLWRAQQKLQSLGTLLERQGDEREGFIELTGLGLILTELGQELEQVFHALDQLSVQRRQESS
jgi:hypothetical protein